MKEIVPKLVSRRPTFTNNRMILVYNYFEA